MTTFQERYAASLMNTFGPPKLTLVRGEGAHVWDADGKEYVDLLGGIAVNALGHAHPALVAAVTEQLQTLGHVSNFFATEPQIEPRREAAGAPAAPAPGKVFFTNSGAEANEAAFKLTRRTGRTHVVAAEGGFHGRTMGALALTSKAAYREPFEPLPGEVTFVPYGDADALAAAVTDRDRRDPARADPGRGRRRGAARGLPRGRPPDRRRARRPALARRGADRDGPDRAVVRPPRRPAYAPTSSPSPRASAGGFPIGACIGARRGRRAAPARQPRHHLRRQPGRLRGRARGHRHHRGRRAARARHRARPEAPRRPGRRPAGHRGPRRGAADRPRPGRRRPRPRCSPPRWRPASSSTTPRPSRIRLAPPLVLTEADAAAFLEAWPAILDKAGPVMTQTLPGGRRPQPGRAGRGARPRRQAQGLAVRRAPVRRPAVGRDDLRQADAADPGLLRRRHRRARRQPDAGRRQAGRHRRPRVRRGRRPGARPPGRRRSSGGPSRSPTSS